ncbi:uncharacterized protein LOC144440406 [Glandiceps talaboti]
MAGRVMISYCWANKDIVWKIEEELRLRHKITTWIDKKDIGGNLYEGMATGVDTADIVILCISEDYQKSANCGKEGQLAAQKKKTIIPIKVTKVNILDGWTGIVCAGKLWIDFTNQDNFDEKVEELVRRIYEESGAPVPTDTPPYVQTDSTTAVEVSEDDLLLVEENIGMEWKRLGRTLGFNDADLTAIDIDNYKLGLKEVISKMIRGWKDKDGKKATKEKLKEALRSVDRTDLAEQI